MSQNKNTNKKPILTLTQAIVVMGIFAFVLLKLKTEIK